MQLIHVGSQPFKAPHADFAYTLQLKKRKGDGIEQADITVWSENWNWTGKKKNREAFCKSAAETDSVLHFVGPESSNTEDDGHCSLGEILPSLGTRGNKNKTTGF